VLPQARTWGLTNRRNRPLSSQALGMLLRNQLYAGIVDVPEYGVRGKRADFEPLISEELFYRAQAVLSGRVQRAAPPQRAHPDFPLRAFVRCQSCGRGLTGSWSKGSRLEVPLRERAAGARFQVALEANGAHLILEFDHDVKLPGLPARRVRAASGIVVVQACGDI
jgi:hypothetical protein